MITAYKLFTGPDGHSHVIRGSVVDNELVAAQSIHFAESSPLSHADWHSDPATQYVITLSGNIEFATFAGEIFTIQPGDVLIVLDSTGTGHKWHMKDHQSWRRAYVVFKEGTTFSFRADNETPASTLTEKKL